MLNWYWCLKIDYVSNAYFQFAGWVAFELKSWQARLKYMTVEFMVCVNVRILSVYKQLKLL